MSLGGIVVVTGFVYSLVGSVLRLVGFAVVSREWIVGFLYSSSDLFLLFGFFRLLKWASTCCFEEDPGSRAASSVIASA